MTRAFYFLTASLILLAGVVKAQNKPAALQFHSSLEEEAIKEYLEQKEVDIFALQLISAVNISEAELEVYQAKLNEFVEKLSEKRRKYNDDERFLSYAFYKVNQKFLKRYRAFTSPALLFETGEYDCLSGTTLYALILDRMNIKYDIVETNYHIYLRVQHKNKVFLMESTDPMYGFIADQQEVADRLRGYDNDIDNRQGQSIQDKEVYVFETVVKENIDLYDLAGLHYYNAAVHSFNQEDISSSINNLEKAVVFYFSPRISEFGTLMARTLLEVDQVNEEAKRSYLNRINNLLNAQSSYAVR